MGVMIDGVNRMRLSPGFGGNMTRFFLFLSNQKKASTGMNEISFPKNRMMGGRTKIDSFSIRRKREKNNNDAGGTTVLKFSSVIVFEHAILTVHFATLKTKYIDDPAVENPKNCKSTSLDLVC